MKVRRRTQQLVLVLGLAGIGLKGFSQINTPSGAKVPFGSNSAYEYGIMPGNLPTSGSYGKGSEVASIYNSWKSQYIENCGSDKARVRFDDPSATVSEGIGYGMLLSAYAADKDLFDRLWAYYKQFRNTRGLMHWKISGCNSVAEQNGATDADLDAAMGLIVASKQWPSSTSPHNYKSDGVSLINAIKSYEINSDGTFENGDAWKPSCRNPSYQAPGYAKAFKLFMAENGQNQNSFWDNVSSKTESLFASNAHSSSGLSTNWCTPQGPPNSSCSGSGTSPDKFGYDACRAPWRQGVDVLWWGPSATGQVQSVINRQADFWINKGGAGSVQGSNSMNWDGSGSGDHNGAYTGPIGAMSLGAASSAARQSFVNALYTENKKSQMAGGYFTAVLQMLGLFVQSGNFWNPYGTISGGSNTPPTVSLTSPTSNTSVCQGASITITASASDADGTVSKVEFYNGTTLIDTKTASPYTITYPLTASGTAGISAKVYDNDNDFTSSTTVSVTVTASPAAPVASAAVNYCTNSAASPLQATGQNLKWYTDVAGNSSTTAPTPPTTAPGSVTYYVSQSSGTCESPKSQITVTVSQAAAPGVTSPVNYCQGQTAAALIANGTGLKWYTQASGGNSTNAQTPSTTTTGNVSYFVSQTVNNCESPRSEIVVSVGAATSAPSVTSPVSYCQNASASPLAATGQNLGWYTVQTNGTKSTAPITPNTAATGTTVYYVSQTIAGCESNRSPISVTVNTAPAAPAVVSPVTYKLNETASALSASGNGLKWYTSATGGNGSTNAPVPNTTQAGNSIFYVSQTGSNGCESNRASIEVKVVNAVDIIRAGTVPVIDGNVDATWSQATAYPVSKILQGTLSGPEDLSASFKLMWDNSYLYVLGQVTDDVKMSDSNPVFDDDGVEVYFDYGNDKAGTYGTNDVQYTFKWNSTAASTNQAGKSTSGINYSLMPTSTGYTFEARIPWTNLGGAGVMNQIHGFDFQVNDDDNGAERDAKIAWNAGTDDAWQNTALFGTIILKENTQVTTGFEDVYSTERISFYPNPFRSEIQVKGLSGTAGYEIMDLNGRKVQSGTTEGVIHSYVQAGVYYLVVHTATGKQTLKMVKTE